MDFKVGDKILCSYTLVANNRKDNDISGQMIHFVKGRYYSIVDYRIQDRVWHYVLKSELSNNCHIPENSMFTWFYTDKEVRKLKLEEIETR